MSRSPKIERSFFMRDVLEVAPELPGKYLSVHNEAGVQRYMITEVEAYRGEEDGACHARNGMTARNSIMYENGGMIYMYLIYGIYWMMNIVTSVEGIPQAVLLRGIDGFDGPGKLTRHLNIDGSYYGMNICESDLIWIEDMNVKVDILRGKRIGIDYADEYWRDIEWRFYVR